VHALAGELMPAAEYVRLFQPDWQTLREVWSRYKQRGRPEDLADLAVYAQSVTERKVAENDGVNPAYFWLSQAMLYNDLQRSQEALVCLEKAYAAGPHIYAVRLAIGRALLESERFAEAEPHVRWCLARRPDNKALSAALVEITKQRFAQRSSSEAR
jgi:tetratricopeptide (TPR) repeat protein